MMERNDGQRRRDAADGYAPFEVRPALRLDPAPRVNHTDVLVSVLALAILAATFYVAIRFAPPALLNTIFQSIPIVIFPGVPPL